MVAVAVEQILVSVGAVASAIAMELDEQVGVLLRNLVRLAHLSGELHRVKRLAQSGDSLSLARLTGRAASRGRRRSSGRLLLSEHFGCTRYQQRCHKGQEFESPVHGNPQPLTAPVCGEEAARCDALAPFYPCADLVRDARRTSPQWPVSSWLEGFASSTSAVAASSPPAPHPAGGQSG